MPSLSSAEPGSTSTAETLCRPTSSLPPCPHSQNLRRMRTLQLPLPRRTSSWFSSCASFFSSDLLLLGLQWLFFCFSGLHRRLKAMDAERYKPRPIYFSALPPLLMAFHGWLSTR